MAHSTPDTRTSQQAVLRPIIATWGLSLCFLVGLIVGVPQASQIGADSENARGALASSQRVAASSRFGPGYGAGFGLSSLAVERFDREMAAKDEACRQARTHEKAQARTQERAKIRSRAKPRPNPVAASTRS